jgi:uncharacterized protein YecT (DUF1311 family)
MKHILVVAILAIAAPQVAVAQDTPFDIGPTARCLSSAISMTDKRDCVGQASEGCADLALGGFSTRSMTACLGHELAFFDDMLNTEYGKVRGLARDLDKAENGTSYDSVTMADRLLQMQRAWITYRDATCAYEQRQYDGGTIGDLVQVDCMTQLTAEQAFRLQSTVLGL